MLDSLLFALGLKKVAVLAGAFAGAIGGVLMPGPSLAAFSRVWARVLLGACFGGAAAGWGSAPIAGWIGHPDYLGLISFCLGLWALSFAFKIHEAINAYDFGKLFDKILGRSA